MMKTKLYLPIRALLASAALLSGASAFAQYTGEFVICLDGSSPDNCRNSALPIQNDGSVIWGRDLGTRLCTGVGIVPQDTDCTFLGRSYNGSDCVGRIQDIFGARVTAGVDMALACGDVDPLPNGDFSLIAFQSSCFDDTSVCQNFTLTDITP